MKAIFKVMNSKDGIFGENFVVDWYMRIEEQARGSLHMHAMIWCNGAPKFDDLSESNINKNINEIINFVDKHITTDADEIKNENMKDYQTHKHTKTCQRTMKGNTFCRFKMPRPPMPQTEILSRRQIWTSIYLWTVMMMM